MMKQTIIITALLLSFTIVASATDDSNDKSSKVQLGAKVGLCYSNVYDSDGAEFNADARLGFTGGAFLSIPIVDHIHFQPEVLVTVKGFKGNGTLLGNSYNFIRSSTFLEIPLLLAFKPSPSVALLAGPQFAYLLSQRDEFTSTAYSYDQEQTFKRDNIRKNLLGFVIGSDVLFDQIVLSGRIGMDVQNNRGDGDSFTPRYKNFWAQLSIGLVF